MIFIIYVLTLKLHNKGYSVVIVLIISYEESSPQMHHIKNYHQIFLHMNNCHPDEAWDDNS